MHIETVVEKTLTFSLVNGFSPDFIENMSSFFVIAISILVVNTPLTLIFDNLV